ncbi:beta-galactosidase [Snuella sedimenti]|uniref:Beta-galactosidase n=1 Tax=Snuella sedimenti TaxID=2798802 RepID=A0A8J7J640_9FLAO|nr:beta-galactosidase [Snuella sedimenti]MBJ6369593.1 beta-galactosidase [Snuella sedimenti]
MNNHKTKFKSTRKKLLSYIVGILCACFVANAQKYKIDLSQVAYPEIATDFKMGNPGKKGKEIKVNSLYMTEGGSPVLPVMGEFHFSRYDHRYWEETLLKMKASGIDIVSSYVFWIYHEEIEGQMDWTGNNDIRKFVELCKTIGLKLHLRVGPYINAECRNGGLPDWLMKKKYIKKRYNDPLYLEYVRNWYRAIYNQIEGFLYKEDGPIMGIQLENEYVRKGHVVPHLLELKKIAIEEGFDVPLYTMTHWMASDYPKKDIIPYAGYYIETPWSGGYGELPVGNFEFFSYNRLSDNIGTDLIQLEGDVQSLNSKEVESPYFTCEVGLGTPTFYHRRPIVPKEMAGENINLRLGCGVNLMGYYMYSGGSHKIGRKTTLQSSTSRVSYDYQAPLGEFGTLGAVMGETKKLNYFMNDFGVELAPMVAYLPTSNGNTDNLQWAVRAKDNQAFLFCSNYLYKRTRPDYKGVQFQVALKSESLQIPRKPITVEDGAYFTWPINLDMEDVRLAYATVQPISKLSNDKNKMWVFFQDDGVPAEYFFKKDNIKSIHAVKGAVKKEKNGYFISGLRPGTDCVIEIEQTNGTFIKILTLTADQSDKVWKLNNKNEAYFVLSESGVFMDKDEIIAFSESNDQKLLIYPESTSFSDKKDGVFSVIEHKGESEKLPVEIITYRPMEKAYWIQATNTTGKSVITKDFEYASISKVAEASIRFSTSNDVTVLINDQAINTVKKGNYWMADLSSIPWKQHNTITITSSNPGLKCIAEIEAFLENGDRLIWNTDNTWETVTTDGETSVQLLGSQNENGLPQFKWGKEDKLAYYELKIPENIQNMDKELRLNISFTGDRADAFLGSKLFSDYLFDGTPWVIGINRFKEYMAGNPFIIRIKAFESTTPKIYFEKYVDTSQVDRAQLLQAKIKPEYRFQISLY